MDVAEAATAWSVDDEGPDTLAKTREKAGVDPARSILLATPHLEAPEGEPVPAPSGDLAAWLDACPVKLPAAVKSAILRMVDCLDWSNTPF